MIRISLGNVGSGKTVMEVREMILNRSNRKTYSNIITKKIKNNHIIKPDMIVRKEVVRHIKRKTGSLEPVHEYKLNTDFWKQIKEPINVVLDEAHTIVNARRAMSKLNIIVTNWLALIRRVLGQAESGYGELVFITQLPNRIDVIARDMATQVRYHLMHYTKKCGKCGMVWGETSDHPEPLWTCFSCGSWKVKKYNHRVEVWHFGNMDLYNSWKMMGIRTHHKHYIVEDIEKYFPYYNTLQWDNLFESLY